MSWLQDTKCDIQGSCGVAALTHGFARGKVHPGPIATAMMAHYWFDALCRYDGIETPAWSRDEMERAMTDGKPK